MSNGYRVGHSCLPGVQIYFIAKKQILDQVGCTITIWAKTDEVGAEGARFRKLDKPTDDKTKVATANLNAFILVLVILAGSEIIVRLNV